MKAYKIKYASGKTENEIKMTYQEKIEILADALRDINARAVMSRKEWETITEQALEKAGLKL